MKEINATYTTGTSLFQHL